MPSAVRLWLKLIFDWPGYFKEQSPKVFCKKGVFRNISKLTGKHLCQILFFDRLMACNFIKKETLPQVFSCEFYKIPKNTFSTEHLRWLLLLFIFTCTLTKSLAISTRYKSFLKFQRMSSFLFGSKDSLKIKYLFEIHFISTLIFTSFFID